MQDQLIANPTSQKRVPWNKGKANRQLSSCYLGIPKSKAWSGIEVDDPLAIAEQVDV